MPFICTIPRNSSSRESGPLTTGGGFGGTFGYHYSLAGKNGLLDSSLELAAASDMPNVKHANTTNGILLDIAACFWSGWLIIKE